MSSTSSPLGDPRTAPLPADTVKVLVPGEHSMVSLLGTNDELLKLIENAFTADIHVRGNEITIATADPAETARVARLFEELVLLLGRGQLLDKALVRQTIRMIRADEDERPSDVLSEALITHRGRTIRPKTLGQKRYLDAIKANTVTFGIGPAGTGKTYLAMGAAVQALRAKQVNRLILTRPAVEAGERLGFLPGTLHEKIDPYLKPLWDALHDMMEAEELIAHVDRGTIEVAPLAYMRGRTLNDAFIVLDEAQNTTAEQMKMFLTRIGFNSKAVVTGDVSQVDLPSGRKSGLRIVGDILEGIEGVAFSRLGSGDVVRHHIVQRIVEAYAEWDKAQEEAADRDGATGRES
ncbi:PhoH family protein [Egicoccus sp. AB-alg2]|uniref:PhoH family protein n=1 Tax=Egicoccus sp. AB-alg2 TaxID=3242693 RepID=UPI00359DB6E4